MPFPIIHISLAKTLTLSVAAARVVVGFNCAGTHLLAYVRRGPMTILEFWRYRPADRLDLQCTLSLCQAPQEPRPLFALQSPHSLLHVVQTRGGGGGAPPMVLVTSRCAARVAQTLQTFVTVAMAPTPGISETMTPWLRFQVAAWAGNAHATTEVPLVSQGWCQGQEHALYVSFWNLGTQIGTLFMGACTCDESPGTKGSFFSTDAPHAPPAWLTLESKGTALHRVVSFDAQLYMLNRLGPLPLMDVTVRLLSSRTQTLTFGRVGVLMVACTSLSGSNTGEGVRSTLWEQLGPCLMDASVHQTTKRISVGVLAVLDCITQTVFAHEPAVWAVGGKFPARLFARYSVPTQAGVDLSNEALLRGESIKAMVHPWLPVVVTR